MPAHTSDSVPVLASIIAAADPALLLASVVSITGRSDRIDEFARSLSYASAGMQVRADLPADLRIELNNWALSVFASLDGWVHRAPLEVPNDTFIHLASALTGMPVTQESLQFLREQGGFISTVPEAPRNSQLTNNFKVAIIGAGMAGVAMAVAAHRAGFNIEVLEKSDGIGGVWHQNRYPGVGVDTHSKYYSLSFAINRAWSNSYPEGAEFRTYLEDVARDHGVIDKFNFGAEVTSMAWNENDSRWTITYFKDGVSTQTSANVVITACGYLSRPVLPDVPGLESFAGHWSHSANWDSSYDFSDKRVAIVGTGCTSVQIVDALAPIAKSLKVFQRQPHWVTPSDNGSKISPEEQWLLQNIPTYAEWARLHTFLTIGDVNYGMVRYDSAWAEEHDVSISADNDAGMKIALGYLEASFADRPDLLQKLKPDFAFMGKRPIRDPGGYYDALKRDSTELIATGLAGVTPEGPVDGDGTLHEVDAVIYATGFALEFLSSVDIRGRAGKTLREAWKYRPIAYLGCQIPYFPNLFVTCGPNANPSHGGGHNFCVEAVMHYIIECLQTLLNAKAESIEPTTEATQRWHREVSEKLADSIWVRERRANTYYRNAKGDVVLANPFTMQEYWTRLRQPALTDLILS